MTTTTAPLTLDVLMSHAGWLHRLARGLLPDPAGAEDAAQEALATALQNPPDARGSVKSWFGTVMTNRARSDARSAARRQRTATRAAAEPATAVPTPEDIVSSIELQRLVAGLLLQLDETDRQVIYLRYFEDLDSSAIAARLGVAAGTVRWRLKNALDGLRGRLDAGDKEGGARWRRLLAPLGGLAAPRLAPGPALAPLVAAAPVAFGVKLGLGVALAALIVGATALTWRKARTDATASVDPAAASAATRRAASVAPPAFVADPAATSGGPSDPEGPPSAPANLAVAAGAANDQPDRPVPEALLAPFTGVRWQGDAPIVEVNALWFKLLSLDGTPVEAIVAYVKSRYPRGDEWQKRFTEDLVQVLNNMGRPPGWKVALALESLEGGQRTTVTADMTRENRQEAWRKRQPAAVAAALAAAPSSPIDRFARVSPFYGLRFRGDVIEVELDGKAGTWRRLESINGIPAARLVASSKDKHGERWRKRIAEDIVEVLTDLGARPGGEVDLVLSSLTAGGAPERRARVPLTEDNRRRVKRTWEDQSK